MLPSFPMMETSISASEAGRIIGKSRRRVNQLVEAGVLRGRLVGNSNVISRASVLRLKAKQDTKNGNGPKRAAKRKAVKR